MTGLHFTDLIDMAADRIIALVTHTANASNLIISGPLMSLLLSRNGNGVGVVALVVVRIAVSNLDGLISILFVYASLERNLRPS